MHMVFYVCNGRVQIDVSGVQFSAGKGCVFQVPRGKPLHAQHKSTKLIRFQVTTTALPTQAKWMRGSFSRRVACLRKTTAPLRSQYPGPSRVNKPLNLADLLEPEADRKASRRLDLKRRNHDRLFPCSILRSLCDTCLVIVNDWCFACAVLGLCLLLAIQVQVLAKWYYIVLLYLVLATLVRWLGMSI
jgi:hypothetical protein